MKKRARFFRPVLLEVEVLDGEQAKTEERTYEQNKNYSIESVVYDDEGLAVLVFSKNEVALNVPDSEFEIIGPSSTTPVTKCCS